MKATIEQLREDKTMDKRYVKFYDQHGIELLGSDNTWYFDQRWSNQTALGEAYKHIQKQAKAYQRDPERYVMPRQCYAAVLSDSPFMSGVPATLENPLFPDTF